MGGGLELLLSLAHPNLDFAHLYPINQAVDVRIEILGNIGDVLGVGLVRLVVDLEMRTFEHLPCFFSRAMQCGHTEGQQNWQTETGRVCVMPSELLRA